MLDLFSLYTQWQQQGRLEPDPAQAAVIAQCVTLQGQIYEWHLMQRPSLWRMLRSAVTRDIPPKGLYLYGEVGRGKSMIMDAFFETTQIETKRRVHFHAFMQEVHALLNTWRKTHPHIQDPIPKIAKTLSQHMTLLCFDEFHIQDIADAMIIGRLFDALFACQVIVVATSNVAPDDLYKDGLQRGHFLPFIDTLKQRLVVCHLCSAHDYRLRHLSQLGSTYFTPLSRQSNQHLHQSFSELTNGGAPRAQTLLITGRSLTLTHTHGDTVLVDFHILCGQPLGAADYGEIARTFNILILTNIPIFTSENLNEAKRFITLIDECYEHRMKLICSAEALPDALCRNPRVAAEFQRTASRLIEMQSQLYWGLEKK